MPETEANDGPENSVPKCELCECAVTGEAHSTDDYSILCECCYGELWQCSKCGAHKHDDEESGSESVSGDIICENCQDTMGTCVNCELLINFNSDAYIENPHEYQHCCDDCAGEATMYYCDECGNDVYYSEVNHDHAQDAQLCYDCYNRRACHISNDVTKTIKLSDVLLSKHYGRASGSVMDFYRMFYGSYGDEFHQTETAIEKSGGGYGKGYGYYNSHIKVASLNITAMTDYIYKFIRTNALMCDHRKYGLYNPLIKHFATAIKFYDLQESVYIQGDELSMQDYGKDYTRYQMERVSKTQITQMLTEDLEKDKGQLRSSLIKSFNGSLGNRLALLYNKKSAWYKDFADYKTNADAIKLRVKVGFDIEDMGDMLDFNDAVGSCQIGGNRESYAFGLMDMVANPHLVFLIYDGKRLIGRSLVRLWKDPLDADSITFVAPSRLYLSKYTHVKGAIYNDMFSAVNDWAQMNFGADNYKMIAYTTTQHDNASVRDYLAHSRWTTKDSRPATLVTNWWHTWFLEKPDASDAMLTYYKDERMHDEYARVSDGELRHEDYAAREVVQSRYYTIVEEANNTNEQ